MLDMGRNRRGRSAGKKRKTLFILLTENTMQMVWGCGAAFPFFFRTTHIFAHSNEAPRLIFQVKQGET